MAISKTVSLRIPSELLSKIDQLAEEKHSSHKGVPNRSLAILDAITHYFEAIVSSQIINKNAVHDTVSTDKIQTLEKNIQLLFDEVASLKSIINTLQDNVLMTKGHSLVPGHEPQQLSIETQISQQLLIPPLSRKVFVKRLKDFRGCKETTALSRFSHRGKALQDQSFGDWSQRQDIDGIRWREEKISKSNSKQYLPDESLSDELRSRLLKWIKENS